MNKGQTYTFGFEGKRNQTYDDATGEAIGADGLGVRTKEPLIGVLSIGVGHTGHDFKAGDVWTDQQVFAVFDADYDKAVHESYDLFKNGKWAGLGECRQAVICDMAFNLGLTRLTGFKLFLNNCRSGNWLSAANNILYNKDPETGWAVKTRYHEQLETRALKNARMMELGEWQ